MPSSACTITAFAPWSIRAPPIWGATSNSAPKSASAAASPWFAQPAFTPKRSAYPYTFRHLETAAITDIYIKEIEDGIGHSGIRAGLIKIATGDGKVSDYERRMLTAATAAAKATGVRLISHTENCSCGHDQIDIVTEGGVLAHHLLVGHCDGRDDHDYQASLAARGAYVGFDRFGLEVFNSDANRMRNLKQMIDAGYRDQVIVSQDKVNCWLGNIPGVGTAEDIARIVPNWTMTHLFERIFPELLRMGVSQADLDALLLDNPRRFFSGEAPS